MSYRTSASSDTTSCCSIQSNNTSLQEMWLPTWVTPDASCWFNHSSWPCRKQQPLLLRLHRPLSSGRCYELITPRPTLLVLAQHVSRDSLVKGVTVAWIDAGCASHLVRERLRTLPWGLFNGWLAFSPPTELSRLTQGDPTRSYSAGLIRLQSCFSW